MEPSKDNPQETTLDKTQESDPKNDQTENTENVSIPSNQATPSEQDLNKMIQNFEKMTFHKSKKKGDEKKDFYKFWTEQPVPQFDKEIGVEFGPINVNCKVEDEQQTPYKLPAGFEWYDIDINNPNELNRLYEFLRDNYVEDDDHMFRFDYCKEFLKWHLSVPGHLKQWCASVVKDGKKGGKKMIGFISAIPVEITIKGTLVKMVEINFLCVNALYRTHRLAPVLIKEITRRVHCQDLWQAVYTAGVTLPKPFAKCTYYHRNLNVQKLLDVKFTYLGPNMNLARAKGIYKVAKETTIMGLRPMEEKDVDGVYQLLDEYLSKFEVRGHYSKEEVAHWFLPREGVVYSYVVENLDTYEITDFISFYSLPSSILQHDYHKKLNACYAFFNVAKSVTFKELMKNALILAKQQNFDVYNALNIMDNATVFEDLLFGQGDGTLKYYFYNFVCPEIKPNELSLVLM